MLLAIEPARRLPQFGKSLSSLSRSYEETFRGRSSCLTDSPAARPRRAANGVCECGSGNCVASDGDCCCEASKAASAKCSCGRASDYGQADWLQNECCSRHSKVPPASWGEAEKRGHIDYDDDIARTRAAIILQMYQEYRSLGREDEEIGILVAASLGGEQVTAAAPGDLGFAAGANREYAECVKRCWKDLRKELVACALAWLGQRWWGPRPFQVCAILAMLKHAACLGGCAWDYLWNPNRNTMECEDNTVLSFGWCPRFRCGDDKACHAPVYKSRWRGRCPEGQCEVVVRPGDFCKCGGVEWASGSCAPCA